MLDKEVDQLEDHDGWGVVGMAIHGTCGHREKESVVRTVVSRWGLDAGPRRGTDKCEPMTTDLLYPSYVPTIKGHGIEC